MIIPIKISHIPQLWLGGVACNGASRIEEWCHNKQGTEEERTK